MDSIFQDVADQIAGDDRSSDVFARRVRAQERETPQSPSFVEYGAGWYHEAAIADERGAHAHPYRR